MASTFVKAARLPVEPATAENCAFYLKAPRWAVAAAIRGVFQGNAGKTWDVSGMFFEFEGLSGKHIVVEGFNL